MQRSVGDILKQEDSHVPANHRPDRRRGFNRVSRRVSGKRNKTLPQATKMMGRGMETRPAVRRSEVRRHQPTAGA